MKGLSKQLSVMLCLGCFLGACLWAGHGAREGVPSVFTTMMPCTPFWLWSRFSVSSTSACQRKQDPGQEGPVRLDWLPHTPGRLITHLSSNNKQVTPRHMAPPQSSPGLFGVVPRASPGLNPSAHKPQHGAGLLALCPRGTITPPCLANLEQNINTILGSISMTHVFGTPGGPDSDDLKKPKQWYLTGRSLSCHLWPKQHKWKYSKGRKMTPWG